MMPFKETLSAFCASVSDPAFVRAISYEMREAAAPPAPENKM
jgi:hypothetical protein